MCKESRGSIALNWQLYRSPEWATAVVPIIGKDQLSRRKGLGLYWVWFIWFRDFLTGWLSDWRRLKSISCLLNQIQEVCLGFLSYSSLVQYQESLDWLGLIEHSSEFLPVYTTPPQPPHRDWWRRLRPSKPAHLEVPSWNATKTLQMSSQRKPSPTFPLIRHGIMP